MTCPSCGTTGSGHYCSNCGASLAGSACAACGAELRPGAKFCHRCGAPVGTKAPATVESRTNALPWIVAALAFLALFAMAAGRGFTARYGVDKLVWFEIYDDAITAITREKELKKWRRDWKIRLIEENTPELG